MKPHKRAEEGGAERDAQYKAKPAVKHWNDTLNEKIYYSAIKCPQNIVCFLKPIVLY